MRIIYGPKGTGKTQVAIDAANQDAKNAKGHILYISDSDKNMYDLNHEVRYIDSSVFAIVGEDGFRGFLKGLVAANADTEKVYVDGLPLIVKKDLVDMREIFDAMAWLGKSFSVEFVVTASGTADSLPDFIKKYI